MKYKVTKIHYDNDLLKDKPVVLIADYFGCDPAWISRLKNNKAVATEKFYLKLKNVVDKMVKEGVI